MSLEDFDKAIVPTPIYGIWDDDGNGKWVHGDDCHTSVLAFFGYADAEEYCAALIAGLYSASGKLSVEPLIFNSADTAEYMQERQAEQD